MYISKVKPDRMRVIMNSGPVKNACLKECWHCCTREYFYGVGLTDEEYAALEEHGAKHLSYERAGPMLRFDEKGCCEFVKDGKCILYDSDIRPMMCGLFTCF